MIGCKLSGPMPHDGGGVVDVDSGMASLDDTTTRIGCNWQVEWWMYTQGGE